MSGLFGCTEKETAKYKVDYSGQKDCYQNAADEYAAGDSVELYYFLIATDTDYSFFLDGERINTDYESDKGYIIRFTMPEHAVKLECRSHNSMVYVPPTEEADAMLIDSYRATVATVGGDGYDEIVLYSYDNDTVRMNVYCSRGDTETEFKYLVPYEAADKCYAIIDRYKLREWNGQEALPGMTGVLLVCKFKDGDSYVRVSSEHMPEDGEKAFSEIESVLRGYIKEAYKVMY